MSQPLEYETLSYGAPDGAIVNASSVNLGFYGKVPIEQPTIGTASTYIVHGQSTASASTYGLNSANAVTSLVHSVSTMVVALKNLGLVV